MSGKIAVFFAGLMVLATQAQSSDHSTAAEALVLASSAQGRELVKHIAPQSPTYSEIGEWSAQERQKLHAATRWISDEVLGFSQINGEPLTLVKSEAEEQALAYSHGNVIVLSGSRIAELSERSLAAILRHEITYLENLAGHAGQTRQIAVHSQD